MTELAKVALEFARVVLGFPEAALVCDRVCPKKGSLEILDLADLAIILSAIRAWCDANEGAVELAYYGYIPGEWEASISSSVSVETIIHADPCQALMASCLEAARKLKTAR